MHGLTARAEVSRPAFWMACSLSLLTAACLATDSGSGHETIAVANFGRAPGLPLGTGSEQPALPAPEERRSVAYSASHGSGPSSSSSLSETSSSPPCTHCLELNVDVADINQRDEFGLALDGQPLSKVSWSLIVQFNSDQLAVQPFIDDTRGTYTSLHVNRFPLGETVIVEQEFSGTATQLGLVVGSSGAWTGNETMSVFVQQITVHRASGDPVQLDLHSTPLQPLTSKHHPKVVLR